MSLVCVRAEPEHAPALVEFYRAAWDAHTSTQSVRESTRLAAAENLAQPGVAPPAFIALHDGHAVGYVGTLPCRLWNGKEERPAYWIKGLTVLATHRHGPIGFLLLREAVRDLGCTGALVVAPEARRLFGALGYTDLGVLHDYVRPLRVERILQRFDPAALGLPSKPWLKPVLQVSRSWIGQLLGRCLNLALRGPPALQRLLSRRRFLLRVRDEPPDQGEIDALWQRTRGTLRAASVRDGLYISRRYGSGSGGGYRFVSAYGVSNGKLAGLGVIRRPSARGDERLHGINVAVLSDLLYPPDDPAAGRAIVGAAERAALDLGADVLLCGTSAPSVGRLLRQSGYISVRGRVHFLFRDVARPVADNHWPASALDWWLTRGDSEAEL